MTGLLARIRLPRAEPPAALVPAGPELAEDDLEQVVGGLERVYLPGPVVAG